MVAKVVQLGVPLSTGAGFEGFPATGELAGP